MSGRKRRADKTKSLILKAAGELFAKKGYESVTMREIAKRAGYSHTAIYLYFKDKETLLYQLSKTPLETLYNEIKLIAQSNDIPPLNRLKKISRIYILFGLTHQNMYGIFINTQSSRVDEEIPDSEINKLRLKLFTELEKVIVQCLSINRGEVSLSFTRIFFYTLHGMITTYQDHEETVDELLERLGMTFELATESLVLGFHAKLNKGVQDDEGN